MTLETPEAEGFFSFHQKNLHQFFIHSGKSRFWASLKTTNIWRIENGTGMTELDFEINFIRESLTKANSPVISDNIHS